MIHIPAVADQPVAVMGLGKSGLSAAAALHASGAEVWAWDDNAARRAEAQEAGFAPVDLSTCDWKRVRSLVLSPGIPHSFPRPHKAAELARKAGVEIIGDIELLARAQPDARYLGVTGTNGKSTTTALLGHVLAKLGKAAQIGGNIGAPVLEFAPAAGGFYVIEMSSYQLELTHSLIFDVAILLNITPDHLDRHGGMDGYVAAKRRIFKGQRRPQTAVIGVDDALSNRIHEDLRGALAQIVIPISAARTVEGGVFVVDGVLHDAIVGAPRRIADLRPIATLPGRHNWQNAAAVYAACRAIGLDGQVIVDAMTSYPGLPHRQELVAVVDGALYINDSKATNADAAAKALGCYDDIYWIAGGQAKEGGIAALAEYFPRMRKAYLIGAAAAAFGETLGKAAPWEIVGTLEAAVAAAHRDAHNDKNGPGAVVLLSPACASFDQFPNFEARGDLFRRLALALPGAARPSAGGRA